MANEMYRLLVITGVIWCTNADGIKPHLSDEIKSMLSKTIWDHEKTDLSIHGPLTLDVQSSFKLKKGQIFLKSRVNARHKDCFDIKKHRPLSRDGVYTIYPDLKTNKTVFCDMTTDGGRWTVIQRRQSGHINFYRNWKDYKNGFGQSDDEYWLGDSLRYSGGSYFSTKDADNDNGKNDCANVFKSGWWHKTSGCFLTNLNGIYNKASKSDATELSCTTGETHGNP